MPDSPPPLPAANAPSIDQDDHATVVIVEVSADRYSAAPACLAAPPRDVGRMLQRYGTTLPRYLDAQRLREIEASHERWPLLRPAHPSGKDAGS